MALHCADLDMEIEYGVQPERARNLTHMVALKLESEQAKKELAEEKGRMSSNLEKIKELRVMPNM